MNENNTNLYKAAETTEKINNGISIPTEVVKKLSQCERFSIGLAKLARECGLVAYECNRLCGMVRLEFNDGSSVGMSRAWVETGLLSKDVVDLLMK